MLKKYLDIVFKFFFEANDNVYLLVGLFFIVTPFIFSIGAEVGAALAGFGSAVLVLLWLPSKINKSNDQKCSKD